MRIVSMTIETSATKNLGNYQSVKASLSLTITMDIVFDDHSFEEQLYAALETVNLETQNQLKDQLQNAQKAIIRADGEAF